MKLFIEAIRSYLKEVETVLVELEKHSEGLPGLPEEPVNIEIRDFLPPLLPEADKIYKEQMDEAANSPEAPAATPEAPAAISEATYINQGGPGGHTAQ